MKILKWWFVVAIVTVLAIAVAVGIAWLATAPAGMSEGSESAARLEPGPHAVGSVDLVFTDETRPTPANADYPGAAQRALVVKLWYPEKKSGEHPLVVFAHGLFSDHHGGTYYAEHLASHGYVVVAPDFPLSNRNAPGGATYLDVIHQPGDVSFVIDRVLALEGPFAGDIDPSRISAFGISLGGLTATLAAFHPEWRDERIKAAISISGPGDVFGPGFFANADVPFLMIAATADAIVDYDINARPIPDRVQRGGLLTIEGGTHAGSTYITAGLLRILGNPDDLGCGAAPEGAIPPAQSVFVGLLGTAEQGFVTPEKHRPPCAQTYEDVMSAGRQQMIVALAVRAFFESHFAATEQGRAAHATFLTTTLATEVPEVSYATGRRARTPSRPSSSPLPVRERRA